MERIMSQNLKSLRGRSPYEEEGPSASYCGVLGFATNATEKSMDCMTRTRKGNIHNTKAWLERGEIEYHLCEGLLRGESDHLNVTYG